MLIDDRRHAIDWGARIDAIGRACLSRIGAEVQRADRLRAVSSRSRLLCAGLAALALEVDRALGTGGGGASGDADDEVADLAASLSILTKIDDEVIDALSFHGGAETDRAIVRRETARFLAVTERSLCSASPVSSAPRAVFAAAIGERIARLARSERRSRELCRLIHMGWATQVDAVVTFTSWPDTVPLSEVDRVTRRVSGDWLAIVAACGALRSERGLSDDEIEAIRDAGHFIQRADALADLEKDQGAGLGATWAGVLTERVLQDGAPIGERYFVSRRLDLERLATPTADESAAIDGRLAGLGGFAPALDWVREMLLGRYRAHPLYRSSVPPSQPATSVPISSIPPRTPCPDEPRACSAP